MKFWHGLVLGFIIGVMVTFFTSVLTELIVLAVAVGVIIYVGRKRWGQQDSNDTPSTTKTSL